MFLPEIALRSIAEGPRRIAVPSLRTACSASGSNPRIRRIVHLARFNRSIDDLRVHAVVRDQHDVSVIAGRTAMLGNLLSAAGVGHTYVRSNMAAGKTEEGSSLHSLCVQSSIGVRVWYKRQIVREANTTCASMIQSSPGMCSRQMWLIVACCSPLCWKYSPDGRQCSGCVTVCMPSW